MPRRLSRASVVRVFRPGLSVSSTGQSSHILIRCSTRRSTIRTVYRDRYPKASDTSSPPCLLRLLPAGANRRVGLAPTGKRRLVTAHTLKRHSQPRQRSVRRPGSGRSDMPVEPLILNRVRRALADAAIAGGGGPSLPAARSHPTARRRSSHSASRPDAPTPASPLASGRSGRGPPTMAGYCYTRNTCPSCSAWRYVVTSIASTLFSMELRSRRNPDAPTRSSRI